MEDTNLALKNIAKGAGIFSIGLFISKVLAYAYRLVIARTGVEQYGLISIAMAVFGIFVTFSILGMSEGVTRFVSFYKGRLDQKRIKGVITSALKITLPLSVVGALFLFFTSDWIAITFFHDSSLSILFKIFAFGIPFDVLRSIFFSSIRAFQRVEYEVYAKNVAENVTKIVLTLFLVYAGFGVIGATIAYVASVFVSFILSFYFMEKKVFPILKTKIVSIRSEQMLLSFSIPLLFTGVIYLIIQWTDTLMLGYFKTSAEVGVYNAALPTAMLLYLFPSAIRALFFPVLSEIYAQNKMEIFKSIYSTITKWILIIDSIIFVFLITFSRQIISFLFGEAYVVDQFSFLGYKIAISVFALIILTSGIVLSEFLGPAKDVLLVLKRTKLIFLNTTVGCVFNVVFNFILIPKYGMIGAAIATGFAYLIIFILMWIEAYVITRINPFRKDCLKIVCSSGFILFLILAFKFYTIKNILWLIILSVILSGVYFILLLLTKSFNNEDIAIMDSIRQKLGLKWDLNKVLRRFT